MYIVKNNKRYYKKACRTHDKPFFGPLKPFPMNRDKLRGLIENKKYVYE